mgnify:CR=1 FL=1
MIYALDGHSPMIDPSSWIAPDANVIGRVVLGAEDGTAYVRAGQEDPYQKLFGGLLPYQVLEGVPWNRLQVIAPPS